MRRLMTSTLALAATTLALTACGADNDDTGSEAAVAALGSQIAVELPADQAFCTAQKIVSAVGVAKLKEAGALNSEGIAQLNGQFDKTVAGQIADATVACWDWREQTKSWASAYPVAEPQDWDAYVACAEKLDDKLHASIVAANLKGASVAPREAFTKAQQECRKVLGAPVS